MSIYYDGTKLLSLLDINGNKPEIYIVTTNRSAGKTTYFARLLVNKFISSGEKFCLIYRYNYELDDCADKFFKDIQSLFFQKYAMTSKRKAAGIYHELFLNDKSCGYAISLNSADQLKKYAHMFNDVERMLFDEFQSETSHYCTDEIKKFISIHTSIARGQGKQVRYVPVYMLSNTVSLINPYYTALGISDRLKSNTIFLRGNGFILEQGFNATASTAQNTSMFNQAFAQNEYIQYSANNIYLNDNLAFIEKPSGKSRYIVTLKYAGSEYAIKEYSEAGYLYVDDKPDKSFKHKISVTTNDHNINYIMLRKNDILLSYLKTYFDKGFFRFKNLQCKSALLKALSY